VDRGGYQPFKRIPIDLIHILLDSSATSVPAAGIVRSGWIMTNS
jgi:hypothetical protein